MAHQAHNISYSKYKFLLDKKKEEVINGSNHKIMGKYKDEINVIAYEFIQNLNNFAQTIRAKISKSKSYTDNEYNRVIQQTYLNIGCIQNTDYYFEHLCEAINVSDPRIFATILSHMRHKNVKISSYNFYYPGHGQGFLGGLCQIFASFLGAYMLINTLLYTGLKPNQFGKYFADTKSSNTIYYAFSDAFESSCNVISDDFQQKYNEILMHIPKVYNSYNRHENFYELNNVPDTFSVDDAIKLSKEMFRLMYTTYAILTIDKINRKSVDDTINKYFNEFFY